MHSTRSVYLINFPRFPKMSFKVHALFFVLSLLHMKLAFGLDSNVKDANNSINGCIEREKQAILQIQQSIHLFSPITPQTEEDDCCKWKEVQCDNQTGHVIALDLHNQKPPSDVPYYYFPPGTINVSLIELQYLEHLDLSLNYLSHIPEFLASLTNLRHLNLSRTNISGTVPFRLGNLVKLEYLDLSGNSFAKIENLKWVSNLSSLEYLDLSMINLSKFGDWLETTNTLNKLSTLKLGGCDLPSPILSPSLSPSNSFKYLSILKDLDVHGNRFNASVFQWLFSHNTSTSSLLYLNISYNQLYGLIPEDIGNMKFLEHLDLSYNPLEGGIPKSFGSLCSLKTLYLIGNKLSGQLEFLEMLSRCGHDDQNSFAPHLKDLDLRFNKLNGTLPESIGNFPELESLYLGRNMFEGVISEAHFSQLFKLKYLDLSSNSLVLNFSSDWSPPFQLDTISLSSCKWGSHFPDWIQTQTNYSELDISNASISGTLPSWFWKGLSSKSCRVNLAYNHINGSLEDFPSLKFASNPELNLSWNHLEGSIPSFLSGVTSLDLSNNKFSGSISFLCATILRRQSFVDLSNNRLSGKLPECDTPISLYSLVILDLSNNNFSGTLFPAWIGTMGSIQALQLRNNSFSGQLPDKLKTCSKLQVLDVGENELSGPIPEWIGTSFEDLIVLSLRSNHFNGGIPLQLCNLSRLQIFDLSANNISGAIPNCINNLNALSEKGNTNETISISYTSGVGSSTTYENMFDPEASMNWKGNVYEYNTSLLGKVKNIDLSDNKLNGEIPREISKLVGLVSLNLSWNRLIGQIPVDIGNLESLQTLDFSNNQLNGSIPKSVSKIPRLSLMNLSNNSFRGEIPTGPQLDTFDGKMYEGNPGLCGYPLENSCSPSNPPPSPPPPPSRASSDGDEVVDMDCFYISMALGYSVGFSAVFVTLLLNTSWRRSYFNFLSNVNDWIYIKVAINKAKLCQLFKTLTNNGDQSALPRQGRLPS